MVYEEYHENVKEVVTDYFIEDTIQLERKPDNFRGLGEFSEASCELRKRSKSSPLTEEELDTLDEYGVHYEEVKVTEEIPETYFFNPKIILNKKIAEKVSAALLSIPELKGVNIVFHQEPREAEVQKIVNDESFSDAATVADENALRKIYEIISTVAINPKVLEDSRGRSLRTMNELVEFLKEDGVRL